MLYLRCAGNRKHHRGTVKSQASEIWAGVALWRAASALAFARRVIGLEQLAAGHGIPGQEGDAALFAPGECFFVAAVGERVAVLHADDGNDFLGLFDFGGRDFAEADVADFSLFLHLVERAERLSSSGVRGSMRWSW